MSRGISVTYGTPECNRKFARKEAPGQVAECVRMRILIVEDEALVALTMEDIITAAGHECVGLARDEAVAVKIAEATMPDLALVDFQLARGGLGATVVNSLRKQLQIRSIFVSANPEDCLKTGVQVGALGCLSKPFSPSQLVAAIDVAQSVICRRASMNLPHNLDLYFTR